MDAPMDDEDAEEARRRFEEDLEVRREAVPAGEELPPGATHEIVEEDGDGEPTVRRRRFSAS
jgi:hypothetical protein